METKSLKSKFAIRSRKTGKYYWPGYNEKYSWSGSLYGWMSFSRCLDEYNYLINLKKSLGHDPEVVEVRLFPTSIPLSITQKGSRKIAVLPEEHAKEKARQVMSSSVEDDLHPLSEFGGELHKEEKA